MLKKYIKEFIFPLYKRNDLGHDLNHIKYVIKRCNELSKGMDINKDILYVAASYHDIGHYLDPSNHEVISAKIFMEDDNIKKYFTNEELNIIKEAIEDHRASSDKEPRSIYGKILSSADRNIDVNELMKRSYQYGLKNYPNYVTTEEKIERAYNHIKDKFGENGYAKSYIKDYKYEKYLKDVANLVKNKEIFNKRFKKINKI